MTAISMQVIADTAKAQKNLDDLNRSVGDIANTTDKVATSFKSLAIGIASSLAAFSAGKTLLNLSDQAQGLENRLKLVTKSARELTQVQNQLLQVSQKSLGVYGQTVSIYSTFAKSLGKTETGTKRLTQATMNAQRAIALSGGSADSASAAIMQLGQGLSSGTLRGEELNSVMEQTPRLANAIADGLGVALGQLRGLAEQGKLTSEVVFNALLSQTEAINNEFSVMTMTGSQGFSMMADAVKVVIGNTLLATGIFSGMGNIFANIGTHVIEYKNSLEAAGTILNLRLYRISYNISQIWGGLAMVVNAMAPRFASMVPVVSLFQKNLANMSAVLLVKSFFDARRESDQLWLSIRKSIPVLRQLTDYSGLPFWMKTDFGYAFRDMFAADSIIEFKKAAKDTADIINSMISRDSYTILRDIFYPRPVAEFAMEVMNVLSLFGLLDSKIIRIGNLRFDMLREGLFDIWVGLSEVLAVDIVQPLQHMLGYATTAIYSFVMDVVQFGRQLGTPFGDFLVSLGQGIGKMVGISSKIESVFSLTLEGINLVIWNVLTSSLLAIRVPIALFATSFGLKLGSAITAVAKSSVIAKAVVGIGTAFKTVFSKEGALAALSLGRSLLNGLASIGPKAIRALPKFDGGLAKKLFGPFAESLAMILNPAYIFRDLLNIGKDQWVASRVAAGLDTALVSIIMLLDTAELSQYMVKVFDNIFSFNVGGILAKAFPFEKDWALIKAKFKRNGLVEMFKETRDKILDFMDLSPVVEYIKEFAEKIKFFFFDIYDKVVGHSYWPDLIEGVIEWAGLLNTKALVVVQRFTSGVGKAFQDAYIKSKNIFSKFIGGSQLPKIDISFFGSDLEGQLDRVGKQFKDLEKAAARASDTVIRQQGLERKGWIANRLEALANTKIFDKKPADVGNMITDAASMVKEPVLDIIPNFIMDKASGLTPEMFGRIAKVGATAALVGIASVMSPLVGGAVLAYFGTQAASMLITGFEDATQSLFDVSLIRSVGEGIGETIGIAISHAISAIPVAIDGILSLFAGLGTGLLTQFGVIGSALKAVLDIVSLGEGGLLFGALLGSAGLYLLFQKKIDDMIKRMKKLSRVATSTFENLLPKNPTVAGAAGTGGLINSVFGKLDTAYLLAGVGVLLSGLSKEVSAWQAILGSTPLLLTSILGPDVAGKIVMDMVKIVLVKVAALAIATTRSIASSDFMARVLGLDKASKISGLVDRAAQAAGRVAARVNGVMGQSNKDAYLSGDISLGSFLKGGAKKEEGNSSTWMRGLGVTPMPAEKKKGFMSDIADKAKVGSTDIFASIKKSATTNFTAAKNVASSSMGSIKTSALVANFSFSTLASNVGAAMIASAAKVVATTKAMSMSVVSSVTDIAGATKTAGSGIFGSALFGKYGKWAAIAGLITMFATSAKAATTDVAKSVESDSTWERVFGSMISWGQSLNSVIGSVGSSLMELALPLLTIASVMQALGGGAILASIGGLLLKAGALIAGFFLSVPALIVGAILSVGLLGLYVFGEGDSFSEKLQNASNSLGKFFGLWGDELSAKEKKLKDILKPNQSASSKEVSEINSITSTIDYSKISERDYGALEKLVTRTNEILTRNNEILASGEELTAANIKEYEKAKAGVDKLSGQVTGKTFDTNRTNFNDNFNQGSMFADTMRPFIESSLNGIGNVIGALGGNAIRNAYLDSNKELAKIGDALKSTSDSIGVAGNEFTRRNMDYIKSAKEAIKATFARPDKYAGVKSTAEAQTGALQELRPFMSAEEIKAADVAMAKLGKAYSDLTNAENASFFSSTSKDIQDLTVKADSAFASFRHINTILIESANKAKGISEMNEAYKEMAASLDKVGIKMDAADLAMSQSDMDTIGVQLANVTSAAKAFAEAPIELRAELSIKKTEAQAQLQQMVDAAVLTSKPRDVRFNELFKLSGTDIKLPDMFNLSNDGIKKVEDNLKIAGNSALLLNDAFNQNKPLEERLGLLRQINGALATAANTVETDPLATPAEKLEARNKRLGLSFGKNDVARMNGKQQGKFTSQTDTLAELTLKHATADRSKDMAGVVKLEKEIAVLKNSIETGYGKAVEALKGKDFFEAMSEKLGKTGLSLTTEQLLGLPNTFIPDAMKIAAEATNIRNRILKMNTSTDGVSAAGKLFQELQKKELALQKILANTPKAVTEALSPVFTLMGEGFSLSKWLTLDSSSQEELSVINKRLKEIELAKNAIKSVNGELSAQDLATLAKLDKEEVARRNRGKAIGSSTRGTYDMLESVSSGMGVSISKMEFFKMETSAKDTLENILKGADAAVTEFNQSAKLDADQEKFLKAIANAQKQVDTVQKGEMSILNEKLGLNIDMNSTVLSSNELYNDMLNTLKAINVEEYVRLKNKAMLGTATDEERKSLNDIEMQKRKAQNKSEFNQFNADYGSAVTDLTERLSKLQIQVDPIFIAKLGPEALAAVRGHMVNLAQSLNTLKTATPGSIEARNAAANVAASSKELNKVSENAQAMDSMKGSFRSAGAEFVKGVLTNTDGAWSSLLNSITGTIFDSIVNKISDSMFGGAFDSLAESLFGSGVLGSSVSSPMYVRDVDKALTSELMGPPAPKGEGIIDKVKTGFDEMLSKGKGMFESLKTGFMSMFSEGGLFGDISKSISGLFSEGGGLSSLFEGFDLGGMFEGLMSFLPFATGGHVSGPGSGTSDSIMARLSNGEFVVNAKATAKYSPILEAINSGRMPKFATGGLVGGDAIKSINLAANVTKPESNAVAQQVINVNITGDISRQTRSEINKMLPSIAEGVNSHNKEKGYR